MNILIDIGHPAHVYLFKNFAIEMLGKGNDVLFTCRDKEFEIALLDHYGFRYKSFGRKYSSMIGKVLGMFKFSIKEWMVGRKFKPDVLLSHGSIYAAHASFLLGKPHIAFEDTFNFEQIFFYKPFTRYILTADYLHPLVSDKVVRYPGYHELAYLHPGRFSPDISILNDLGVELGEKYVIMRLVSWNASHDIGHKGISMENKIKAVNAFEQYAKVFISSEQPLPDQLEKNRIRIAPYRIHHALAFASLVFGESATMAAEGACLGVPGIYLDNKSRLYTKELEEKYGLCYNYSESVYDQELAIQKGCRLLKYDKDDLKREFAGKRSRLIAEKVDVTAFLVRFIEKHVKN